MLLFFTSKNALSIALCPSGFFQEHDPADEEPGSAGAGVGVRQRRRQLRRLCPSLRSLPAAEEERGEELDEHLGRQTQM